jgi:hypothetical protein
LIKIERKNNNIIITNLSSFAEGMVNIRPNKAKDVMTLVGKEVFQETVT